MGHSKERRLVVKWYAQQHKIDFNDTFALIALLHKIGALIGLAAQKCWLYYQLDVNLHSYVVISRKNYV